MLKKYVKRNARQICNFYADAYGDDVYTASTELTRVLVKGYYYLIHFYISFVTATSESLRDL